MSLKVMVLKYLFLEAVSNVISCKHLLSREAEVGREVSEINFRAFLSQAVSQTICIPIRKMISQCKEHFQMYFFLSKSTLKSSGILGFWNKFNRNIMILYFELHFLIIEIHYRLHENPYNYFSVLTRF